MTPSKNHLIKTIRVNGSDANDLRDAAHEACHAIDCNAPPGSWDRDTIHKAVTAKYPLPSDLVRAELLARCVESRVCTHFKEPYDVERWANAAWFETLKNGIDTPHDFWYTSITLLLDSPDVVRLSTEVLKLSGNFIDIDKDVSRDL